MHLEFGVHLQEYVGEGAAEVAAVEVEVVLLRDVGLLAARTEHLFKKGTKRKLNDSIGINQKIFNCFKKK